MSEEFEILSRKIDTLAEIVASSNPRARERVRREMTYVGDSKAPAEKNPNAENLVRQILLDIGAPDHLIGHPFTVEAVMLCVSDSSYANAITKKLYPQIAAKFDSTATRVERAIRHLIETAWDRGDLDVLYGYFGNTVRRDNPNPTNGEFIARIANVVRQQLGET